MNKPKILVVEDERVVAADIEESLQKLGYTVVGAAASAVHAIRRAVETEPDLVLMDIKLTGEPDGIDAAGELHDRLGIPVVFLTAYADSEILRRAKETSPSGYVLKPFDERALRSAVEIALDRHPRERKLAESERRLVTALRGLEDAVILTQEDGRVSFLNRAAEKMTGWKQRDAAGRAVSDVMVLLHARTGSLLPDLSRRVLREGVTMGLGDQTLLVGRNGGEVRIEGTVAPLSDGALETVGAAVVFRIAAEPRAPALGAPGARRNGSGIEILARLCGSLAEGLQDTLRDIAAWFDESGEKPEAAPEKLMERVAEARSLLSRVHRLSQFRIPQPRTLLLNDLIREVQPLLNAMSPEATSVQTKLKEGVGSVSADPCQVDQLLLDLVILAGMRMPFGGRVTIESDNVELLPEFARAHTALEPGSFVVLTVSHAGSVIIPPSETVEADCPAACEVVRDLGGDIQLRSEPGRLTTYEIYLPRVDT